MFEKIRDYVAEQLMKDPSTITPQTDIVRDLKADSLDIVELLLCVENEYDIAISGDDAKKLRTVQDIIDYLAQRNITE